MVTVDAEALLEEGRVIMMVEVHDAEGRRLDWTLTRAELVVVARAEGDLPPCA
jgi:hypothetical protein